MSERDEALAAAGGDYAAYMKAWKMKPDGIEQWEWDHYQNMDPKWLKPELKAKVEKAMGWKPEDTADAEDIADLMSQALEKIDREDRRLGSPPHPKALIARLRAALRLISPDDITPMGKRVLEAILDEEEDPRHHHDD